MGAWSHEPFGNDTACDWSYDLVETTGLSFIESTLDKAIEQSSKYLDADTGCDAIAAIEVIAKFLGKGTQCDAYTEDADQWISKTNEKPNEVLINKALKVIECVLSENSELVELWEGQEEWFSSINNLKSALSA